MSAHFVKSAILRTYRWLKYRKLTKNPSVLRVMSEFHRVNLAAFEASASGGIVIKGSKVDPCARDRRFLLGGSDSVDRLLAWAQARFSNLPDGVLLEVGGVSLKLQSNEELLIASEVFAERIYNLKRNIPFVLIDVGMNVATTSLFFAAQASCIRVHGFELFPRTAEKARENIALNPALAPKITTTEKGWAARSFKSELEYVPEFKGSLGIHGLASYLQDSGALKRERVAVELLDCAEALVAIMAEHPEAELVCKLDCEGSEYEIVEALNARGLLARISAFMIEWHVKGAAPLEHVLLANGFELLSFSPGGPTHSMLYGLRRQTGQA